MNRRVCIAIGVVCMLWGSAAYCGESAKKAWDRLVYKDVGPKYAKWPAFAYVERDPELPNVFLYGDSISWGYTVRVREKLKGKANVFRFSGQGLDSGAFVKRMSEMHKTMQNPKLDKPWNFKWDIIHFNVGLHDLKRRNRRIVNSVETYKENLQGIMGYLKKNFPDAKIIFATTTPVPEGAGKGRTKGASVTYNAAALEVFKEHPEVIINDLYKYTLPNQSTWWTEPGNVHFNETGKKAQGDEVARVILEALSEKGTLEKEEKKEKK